MLGHALIAAYGGIPLIYMGDELATLNDYSYLSRPEHRHDSRWINRPAMDWQAAKFRQSDDSAGGQVFRGIKDILHRRALTPALHAAHPVQVVETGNSGLFGFARRAPTGTLLGLFNLTEHWLNLPEAVARSHGVTRMHDALSDARVTAHLGQIALPPYARVWLT